MSTSENAKIQYEAGQTAVAVELLTDAGDHKTFNSVSSIMSNRSGYAPTITPNGLVTGGIVTPAASGTNDLVDVAGLTCYLAGVLTTVSAATDETIVRAATTDTHRICSVTVTDAGAIAIVQGVDHASEFSETRGADGGPPLIPVGSIEIAQVRTSASDAAPAAITSSEIFQVVGTHQERFDYPVFEAALARVSNQVIGYAGVDLDSASPLIHTGPTAKRVYAAYYTPIFADISKTSDFVPAETSHTVNSQTIYGGAIGSSSSSLNQASFTAYLSTGISDALVKLKNEVLWFKYLQDRLNATPYILTNGKIGIGRTFPADNQIQAACTISSEENSLDVVS